MPATPSIPAAAAEPVRKATALTDSARLAFRAEVDRQLKQMADSLKLSPQQRANARPILLDHAYQVKQLRDKYSPMERTAANREAMTKEMQTLRNATDGKLAGVLSADQMTQYKAMRDAALVKVRAKLTNIVPTPAENK
jgi:ribonuclease HII